jgi:hypothetical protein
MAMVFLVAPAKKILLSSQNSSMQYKLVFVSFSLFSLLSQCVSQDIATKEYRSVVYAEAWGSSLLFSVNYERPVRLSNTALWWRVGAGWVPNRFSIPLALSYVSSARRNALEATLGLSYIVGGQRQRLSDNTINGSGIFLTPGVGYRYQGQHGFLFRVTAYGLYKVVEFSVNDDLRVSRFVPSISVSFGYQIKRNKR